MKRLTPKVTLIHAHALINWAFLVSQHGAMSREGYIRVQSKTLEYLRSLCIFGVRSNPVLALMKSSVVDWALSTN